VTYFSERETGEVPRTVTEIPDTAWRGIVALIEGRVTDGSFGAAFPENCSDPEGVRPIGTDESRFWDAMRGDIPGLPESYEILAASESLPVTQVMDMIEFCWRAVGKPIQRGYHPYFQHHHLVFDIEAGRNDFREAVNQIFRRGGLAYELTEDGKVQRLAPPALREALAQATFSTGDSDLDTMLETARRKFLDPDEAVRREALEKLWDAWERVKTVEPGADKLAQVTTLLNRAADSDGSKFRAMLETEARELTTIGNTFQIRHTETTQEPLTSADHVDYLFHRLFALIRLVLRTTGRGG
jgi:hypothetical protein